MNSGLASNPEVELRVLEEALNRNLGLRWAFRRGDLFREYGVYGRFWPTLPFLWTTASLPWNRSVHAVIWPDASWTLFEIKTVDGRSTAITLVDGKANTTAEAAVAVELALAALPSMLEARQRDKDKRGRVVEALPAYGGIMDELVTTNGKNKLAGRKKPTGTMLTDAIAHGAKVAVADEASTVVLNLAKALIGESYPEFFKTKQGEDIAKIITATAVYHLASNNPDMIPMGENVASACSLVIEASARDIVQPQVGKVSEMFATLGKLGAGIGANAAAK